MRQGVERRVRRAGWPAALLLAVPLMGGCRPPAAAPPGGLPNSPLRVVVISDLNGSYGSTTYEPEVHEAVRRIREEWRPQLVLAGGDLVAGQKPSLGDEEVRAMWAAFDAVVAHPLRAARIPLAITLGNHDASGAPAHARDRRLAAEYWRDPAHLPALDFVDRTHFPFHYSFRQRGVFFLSWDATHAGTARDTALMRWVREQLEGPAARQAWLRIALGHLPLYPVARGRDRPGEVLQEADSLRALLERHGVHTYVSGHHHAYYPGRRGALELLHAGLLGQGSRPLLAGELPPAQTITLLEIHPAGDSIAHTTYAFRRDGERIGLEAVELGTLPPVLRGHNGYVVRRDLPDTLGAAAGATP